MSFYTSRRPAAREFPGKIGAVTSVRVLFSCVLLTSALVAPQRLPAQFHTRLQPETERAFDAYVKAAESKMDWRAHLQPAPGETLVAPGGGKATVDVKDGLVHDWVAATLVAGATVEQALGVLHRYEDYKNLYAPDVRDSKLLAHDGNHWRIYLQLFKKKVLSVLLNSEYQVEDTPLSDGRWSVVSHSTRVVEVDEGRELAPGTGHGFVWRVNVYWLLEPRPGGVYLQSRAITLSRDVPLGLGWAVKPMVTSVPRESLEETLAATARALH